MGVKPCPLATGPMQQGLQGEWTTGPTCVLTVTRDCAIWDVEAKQCHALFTLTEGCKVSQMLVSPLAHQGVGSSSCQTLTNFGPEGSPPEKGTSFAHRMPIIHIGALGSSWSQKFQWVPVPLAFPLHTHFLPTH